MDSIKLNSIYVCNDKESLEQYRIKLNDAIKNKASYPSECDLPEIYIEGNKEIDFGENFGEPYYSEIDINVINSTNTSSCGKKYSNYDRIISSIPYIIKNECKPIAVLKDGDNYCIINGKHRFLAYTLLEKKILPVSIRERSSEKEKMSYSLIEYRRELYNDEGNVIAYPEQVMKFYKENKSLFDDISCVEMKCLEQDKKYSLVLKKRNDDIIEIKNGISAGNEYRSSRVVKELISNCGYDIDIEFIKKHTEFVLKDKYDAHNIVFDTGISLEEKEQEYILEKIANWEQFPFDYGFKNQKILKLHTFLSKYKEFETSNTDFTFYNSGMIYGNEKTEVYYFVGSDSIENKENYVYIFKDKGLIESNLKVQYLGRVGKDNALYKRILIKEKVFEEPF